MLRDCDVLCNASLLTSATSFPGSPENEVITSGLSFEVAMTIVFSSEAKERKVGHSGLEFCFRLFFL